MPEDRQVWAPTANGYFSVKSAYNLVVEMSKGFAYGEASDDRISGNFGITFGS